MTLDFYKKDFNWYADVPNHTEAENLMVDGSDTLLEQIADGRSRITIEFVTDPRIARAVLIRSNHTSDGATYEVFSHDWKISKMKCWICNVTHDVLGEHPELIMIKYEPNI